MPLSPPPQAAIFSKLPAAERAWYANQTIFMGKGACTQYGPRVIPQYLNLGASSGAHPKYSDWQDDLTKQSCLNGCALASPHWSMGLMPCLSLSRALWRSP